MKHVYALFFFLTVAVGFSQQATVDNGIAGFKLYPNPVTQGKVYIETALATPKKIVIFDVFGTKVLETTLLGKELNLSDLDSGIYVIRVYQKDKVVTRKLIVK